MWVNDKVLKDFDGRAKNEIIEVIRAEWDPNYNVSLWCGHCIGEMVTYVYNQMKNEQNELYTPDSGHWS